MFNIPAYFSPSTYTDTAYTPSQGMSLSGCEMAKLAVELFRKVNWDKKYMWSIRRIVIEEFNYCGGK